MSWSWLPSSGAPIVFARSSGVWIQRGAAGLDAPPRDLATAARLSAAGSSLVGQRWAARPLLLPVMVLADGEIDDRVADLAAALTTGGQLAHSNDVRSRELRSVEYVGGLEGIRSATKGVGSWRKYDIELVALDPWWYGGGDVAVLSTDAPTAFDDASTAFDDASTLFDGSAATPISVSGSVPASPITTIAGPFDTLAVGLAGGQSFRLTASLAAGEVITVDTRPGNRGPRLNGGAIDWSLLTEVSRLFELPLGSSVLLAQATGTDGNSQVSVAWDERWLTP